MDTNRKVWIHPTKRVPLSTQLKAAEDWGIIDRAWDIWVSTEAKIEEVIEELRKGDTLGVYEAHLLAPGPNKSAGEKRSDVFNRISEALVDKGVRIVELKTQRSCGNVRDLVRMMNEARNAIAKTTKGNKGALGRPRKFTFSRDDLLWIGAVWSSRDYGFNRQRVKAIKVKFPEFEEQDYYKNRDAIQRAKREPK